MPIETPSPAALPVHFRVVEDRPDGIGWPLSMALPTRTAAAAACERLQASHPSAYVIGVEELCAPA